PQLVISRVKELLAKSQQLPSSINAEVAPPLAIPTEQPPVPDPQSTPTSPIASNAVSPLDDYFDRLDAAITNRQAATPPPPPAPPAQQVAPDSFGVAPNAGADRTMASQGSAQAPVEEPHASAPSAPTPRTTAGAAVAELPTLSDAFAALLAAERNDPTPAAW